MEKEDKIHIFILCFFYYLRIEFNKKDKEDKEEKSYIYALRDTGRIQIGWEFHKTGNVSYLWIAYGQ